MTSADVFEDDWAKAKAEGKKASVGMFLQKMLAEDLDTIFIAFIQAPVTVTREGFQDKTKIRTVMIANIALFDEKGETFQKAGFLEMAPKHWNIFMARRSKFGPKKLYQIERHGVAKDPHVRYDCDAIRDLTEDEMTFLSGVEKLNIHKEGSTESSEAEWLADFRKTCAIEWIRIGWDEAMSLDSIKTLFGAVIKAADMTAEQRMDYISALKLLKKGDAPELCTGELDLGEDDKDFF